MRRVLAFPIPSSQPTLKVGENDELRPKDKSENGSYSLGVDFSSVRMDEVKPGQYTHAEGRICVITHAHKVKSGLFIILYRDINEPDGDDEMTISQGDHEIPIVNILNKNIFV